LIEGNDVSARTGLGATVYAVATIALGIVGLIWRDFANAWQPISAFADVVPGRAAMGTIASAGLLIGGVLLLLPNRVRAGAVLLGVLNAIFAFFWLYRLYNVPRAMGFDIWRELSILSGIGQELSLTAAATIIYAAAAPAGESIRALRTAEIGRYIYGACAISFGVAHFTGLSATAAFVPHWIRPNGTFWAEFTGTCFMLGGIGIVTGILATLAARLVATMILLFSALIWVPILFAHPTDHVAWAGNAVNLAFGAAAWVVADYLARRTTGEAIPITPAATRVSPG
jgi:uncharacterized membrane protein YphA (DoxX/SURF4 family)